MIRKTSSYLMVSIIFLTSILFAQSTNYWQDPRGLFPILAYNYPDGVEINSNVFKVMKQGGINIFVNSNKGWLNDAKNIRKVYDEMKDPTFKWLLIIANECKDDYIFNNHNEAKNKNVNKYLSEYEKNYIYGCYAWDEPGLDNKPCSTFNLYPNNDFEDCNTIVKQIRKNKSFINKLDFINLLPIYWNKIKTAADYEKYIDDFFASQKFKPKVLASDVYPLLNNESGGFRNNYFLNLEILRRKSLQYSIPLWVIVLSSGHSLYVQPTLEQIRMQVFSSLAYGAKGIGYYVYSKSWQQVGYNSWILEKNFDRPGLSDEQYGSKFAGTRKLNNEVQVIGKTLIQLKSLAVYHTSKYPNNQLGINQNLLSNQNKKYDLIRNIIETKDSSQKNNAMIGLFSNLNDNKNKISYCLIVNKDTVFTRTYKVILSGKADIRRIDKISGKEILIGKGITEFVETLDAGEGHLLKVDNYKY